MGVVEGRGEELAVVAALRLDIEVVDVLIVGAAADDELRVGGGEDGLHGRVVAVVEVEQDVEVALDEVGDLHHVRFAAPGELFLAEVVGGELLQAVEGDELFVDVADEVHHLAGVLQLGEDAENGLVGVLVGDLAEHADGGGSLEGANRPRLVGFPLLYVLAEEMILYSVKHTKWSYQKEVAKIQKKQYICPIFSKWQRRHITY